MSQELWQLFNDDGTPRDGMGAAKDDVYKGLLHGASHVWIWRKNNGVIEVLLQRRNSTKRTWPDCWDISAAGHIDLGETPQQAAIRETSEEIGLDIQEKDLALIARRKDYIVAPSGAIENEFRWIYALELTRTTEFTLQENEVASLVWRPLEKIYNEVFNDGREEYVPQGEEYYKQVLDFLNSQPRG